MKSHGKMLLFVLAGVGSAMSASHAADRVASGPVSRNVALLDLVHYTSAKNVSTESMLIDMNVYRQSRGVDLMRVTGEAHLTSCDLPPGSGSSGGGSSGGGSGHPLPVVPVFPDPPVAPSGIHWSINIVIFRQPVNATDGGEWTQTTTYRRLIHRLPSGAWGEPDAWGNPQVTQTRGEMVEGWCEDQQS